MAKQIATPKQTSGGGFTFEDKVTASYFLKMLARLAPLHMDVGKIHEVQFQGRVDGWLIDDLVLSLSATTGISHKVAISVKSNVQITDKGFPSDFVTAIWEQLLHIGTDKFDSDADYLVLATAPLDVGTSRAWQKLLTKGIQAVEGDFPKRLQTAGYANDIERALFASLHCPESVDSNQQHSDTAKLLKRLRHLEFDFESEPSDDENQLAWLCWHLLDGADEDAGRSLWTHLKQLARELSSSGGSIDRNELIARLRPTFSFKEYPDFDADWRKIADETALRLDRVRNNLAGRLELDRVIPSSTGMTAIVGSSGSGKSAIAKAIATTSMRSCHVLWLSPSDLNNRECSAVLSDLRLQHTIPKILSETMATSGLLVIDGFEKLDAVGIANVGTLLRQAGAANSDSPWSFLFVCLVDSWDATLNALRREVSDLPSISVESIGFSFSNHRKAVIEAFPNISKLLRQPHLWPLFANLKLLDLVVSNASESTNFDSWVGETNVLDWFWGEQVQTGTDGVARSRVIQKLAAREADNFSVGTAIEQLESDECRLLPNLESAGILWYRDERVGFQHDLFGDWARTRLLIGHQREVAEYAAEKAFNPRWHRAIRLFGLRLLENRSKDTADWTKVIFDLSPDGQPKIEADLILESILFSANAEDRLADVWEHLLANDGVLLNRLLNRFLHVATLPDPRYAADGDATLMAAHFRMPFWPLWLPLLKVVHRRRGEAISIATDKVTKIASLWLEFSDNNWACRDECAKILLDATNYVVASIRDDKWSVSTDVCKAVFQRVLFAASVFPDDVASLALELCERVESSLLIFDAPEAEIEDDLPSESSMETFESLFGPIGPLAEPWPNGPLRSVNYKVRDGFLAGSDPLTHLFANRPETAQEVLLALLIREPLPTGGRSLGSELHEFLHIHDMMEWSPSMYFRGPFLQFLLLDWQKGIEVIVDLTNFVTDRWLDNRQGQPVPVSTNIDGKQVSYFGSDKAYFWYRDFVRTPEIIAAALMALERWFYLTLDDEQPVGDAITRILKTSRSTALLGVLSAVARKKPELLNRELMPIASIWQMQMWEENHRIQGHDALWKMSMMEWTRWSESTFNAVRDWHTLPHRATTIGEALFRLFVVDEDFRVHMTDVQSQWEDQLKTCTQENETAAFEKISLQFNPDNWTMKQTDEGLILDFIEPVERAERLSASRETLEKHMLVLKFPFYCRQLIDERKVLDGAELLVFWGQLKSISDDADAGRERGDQPEHSIAGGIAVLLVLHHKWLESDSEKERWCFEQIASILESPPPPPEFDVANSISNYYWRNFAAIIGVKSLASDRTHRGLRSLCASFAVDFSYSVVKDVLDFAFESRHELAEDFDRLQRIVILSSGIRSIFETTQSGNSFWACRSTTFDIDARLSELIEEFADNKTSSDLPDLCKLADDSTDTILGMVAKERGQEKPDELHPRVRKRIKRQFGFEPEHLQSAYGWLDKFAEVKEQAERERYIFTMENLLRGLLRPLGDVDDAIADSRDSDEMFYSYPRDFANWLFKLLVQVIPTLGSHDKAERLWRPLLRLGLDRFHWTESFVSSWFLYGLRVEDGNENFFREWRAMMDFAWEQPNWFKTKARNDESNSSLFLALMGYSRIGSASIVDERFRSFVASFGPEYAKCALHFFPHPEVLRGYAILCKGPCFADLRRSGIQAIAEAIPDFSDMHWRKHYYLDSALLDLLELDWQESKQLILRDETVRGHFIVILKAMTDRQIPRALELQDRVIRSVI